MRDVAMLGRSGYERQKNDEYTTPSWCVSSLIEHVSITGRVWDPACGQGQAIVNALTSMGVDCECSDVQSGTNFLDLKPAYLSRLDVNTIVTTPPYSLARNFIEHSLELMMPSRGMVCMLLRHEYDCAKTRKHLFSDNKFFDEKIVLTTRPQWFKERVASPRHNYAWFIWRSSRKNVYPVLRYSP
jgi:hypothetical protein